MVAMGTTTTGAEREAESLAGTTIAQLLTILRNILNWVMAYASKIITWAGEHPLASILLIGNMAIWIF